MSALSQNSTKATQVVAIIPDLSPSSNINDFKDGGKGGEFSVDNKDPEWVIKAFIEDGLNPDDFEDAKYAKI